MVVLIFIIDFICFMKPKGTVFSLNPEEVISFSVQKESYVVSADSPEELAEQVERLNEIQYLAEGKIVPGEGWTYRIKIQTTEDEIDFTFTDRKIIMNDRYYLLPKGSMKDFIDQVE